MIIRSDLPHRLQGANTIHAAGESSPGGLPKDTSAVWLSVPNEGALVAVHLRLEQHKVPHETVTETDGEYAGQMMAIGVRPGKKEELRRHLSSLPLVK